MSQNVRKRVVEGGPCGVLCWLGWGWSWLKPKGDKVFQAVATDAKGVETEVRRHLLLGRKISETSFVPHELKRSARSTRNRDRSRLSSDVIKTIDVKPSGMDAARCVHYVERRKSGRVYLAKPEALSGNRIWRVEICRQSTQTHCVQINFTIIERRQRCRRAEEPA